MTFKQYSDLDDYITRECHYASYKKTKAEIYGLEWTAEDEADYQKWSASYKRITDWLNDTIGPEAAKYNYEIFKEWAIGNNTSPTHPD